jgi:hypothetical protein
MVLAGTISGEVMRFGGMIRVLCLSKEGDLTTVTDDLESILTAYHESGHIVLAATLGRRVKRSGVEKFEQVTDFFLESETPNRQSFLVPGVVQPFHITTRKSRGICYFFSCQRLGSNQWATIAELARGKVHLLGQPALSPTHWLLGCLDRQRR